MRLAGILVPLITPFTADGALATPDLERLAHEVIDDGATGVVALGTTAEAAALTPDERREVLRVVASVCRARGVPLVAGIGSNDTAATARALGETPDGVDAALVVVPYYTRPTEAGIVAHFEHIAQRSPVPIVIYNVPYRTGRSLGAESVTRLARHPRVIGIKQAVGAVDTDTARLIAAVPPSFSVLAGEDTLVSPLLAMGAAGAVAASAQVLTRAFVTLYDLWRDGDVTRARELGNDLVGPAAALMSEPNPVAIKAVLHAGGRIGSPYARLPLLPSENLPAILGAVDGISGRGVARAGGDGRRRAARR